MIRAETAKQFDIRVISPEPQAGDEEIAHALYTTEETAARLRAIMELIKSARSSLTFTNTREFAEILVSRIRTLDKHFPIGIHHSSLSKTVRIDTEKKFKAEEIKSIVATSSLQLGIDIGSIDLVLQYMSPRRVSQLTQRIGRAGHGMDRVSRGIVIATDEDDCFEASVIARRALAGELEPTRFHTNALDVLAHQIVGMTLEDWKIGVKDAYATVRRAWPYHTLTMQDFLSVARQLKILGLVFYDETAAADERIIEKKKRGFEYYFSQLSTIPTTKSYRVFNTLEQTFVGTLDEEFMALHGDPGTTFIVKGEPWRILEVEEDRVLVEPSANLDAAIPGWDGELMPVDWGVAQEVGALRRRIAEMIAKDGRGAKDELKKLYPVDDGVAEKMIKIIRQQAKSEAGVVPDEHNILVEDFENLIVIHSCFGSVVNDTIGRFLAALLTTRVGSVGFKSDPYRIMVQFQTKEGSKNAELVREILLKTNPDHLQDYLELSLTKSEMFEWRFVHVAKRFGAFTRDVQFGRTRLKNIIAEYVGTPLYKEALREIETEKLDVAKASEMLREMQAGKLKLMFHTGRGISPLGRIGVKHKYAEIIGPEKPTKELMALFNRRIMATKERLVCVNCGEWSQTYTIKDMPADVKCPKCGAKLLAIVHPMDTQTQKSVLKKVKGRELSSTDIDMVERARKSSDMYITYGRNAVIIMAGRGIGPATAKRILSRYHVKVEDLLKDMREAEVNFTKTKKFWKT
jgi:ATP-dependent Lhr-like helicase